MHFEIRPNLLDDFFIFFFIFSERYRDLIEAADTISIMKNLSEKVIEDVNKMKTATAELQQRQVSGFKMDYYHK